MKVDRRGNKLVLLATVNIPIRERTFPLIEVNPVHVYQKEMKAYVKLDTDKKAVIFDGGQAQELTHQDLAGCQQMRTNLVCGQIPYTMQSWEGTQCLGSLVGGTKESTAMDLNKVCTWKVLRTEKEVMVSSITSSQ